MVFGRLFLTKILCTAKLLWKKKTTRIWSVNEGPCVTVCRGEPTVPACLHLRRARALGVPWRSAGRATSMYPGANGSTGVPGLHTQARVPSAVGYSSWMSCPFFWTERSFFWPRWAGFNVNWEIFAHWQIFHQSRIFYAIKMHCGVPHWRLRFRTVVYFIGVWCRQQKLTSRNFLRRSRWKCSSVIFQYGALGIYVESLYFSARAFVRSSLPQITGLSQLTALRW